MATQSIDAREMQHPTGKQAQFKKQVDSMRGEIPRFLFRYWNNQSGGSAALNTIDAVTPLAFLKTPDLPSFRETPLDKLRRITELHLAAHSRVTTVYSSWSQSLSVVIAMAGTGIGNAHISILDTQGLPERNVVLHTEHARQLFNTPVWDYEFLVFGTISGKHYKAVAFQEFQHYLPMSSHPRPPVNVIAKEAIRVAEKFGPEFTLVVATYLLSPILQLCNMGVIMRALSDLPWPHTFAVNSNVASVTDPSEKSYFNVVDAWKAAETLQDLALHQYCRSDLFLGVSEQMKQKLSRTLTSRPGKWMSRPSAPPMPQSSTRMVLRSNSSVMASSRLSREVKNLYIDMVGWNDNNDHIAECLEELSLVSV